MIMEYFKNKYTNVIAKVLTKDKYGKVIIKPEKLNYSFSINPDDAECSWIEVNKGSLNKGINIADILKDVPKGTPLYSTIFGELVFVDISEGFINLSRNLDCIRYRLDGRYYDSGECTLFPSKSNRNWAEFSSVWKSKQFKEGDIVLTNYEVNGEERWVLDIFSYYDTEEECYILKCYGMRKIGHVIPYKGNENKLGKLTVEK